MGGDCIASARVVSIIKYFFPALRVCHSFMLQHLTERQKFKFGGFLNIGICTKLI